MPNFNDPSYGFGDPASGIGGLFGPRPIQQGGILGGSSPWATLLDPQVALPIAAQLIGGRTFQDSLAGGFAAAGTGLAAAKKKQAINDWIKAGAPKDIQHPATINLMNSVPELATSVFAQQLTPKLPEFTKIGEGQMGGAQYGWVDPSTKSVTPFNSSGSSGIPDTTPMVDIGPNGQPDPGKQQAFLAGISDPGMQQLVKGIANYEIDPSKSVSLRGGNRERILGIVKQYDPTYDQTMFGARAAMRKTMQGGGVYGQVLGATNQVIQHLDAMAGHHVKLRNSGVPGANWIGNEWASATGQSDIQNELSAFETDRRAVASELAKVFKGTGATAEEEIKNWANNLSPNMSPAQFKGAIDTLLGELLPSRLETIGSQFQQTMGKPYDFSVLTQHTRDVLAKFGADLGSGATGRTDTGGAPPSAAGGPVPDGEYNWAPPQ